ncbi:sodium/calcium exchanger protein, partial [Genlisea aurea]
MAPRNLLPILTLLVLIPCAVAGFFSDGTSADGGEPYNSRRHLETARICEQTYGFLPCTSTVLGNLFLCAVYGYLMYLAATYLSAGSELLLEILGPGIVGGLFLPVLGALPDAMLIL